jgi:MHS family proline/betaine transporter-like MFS transporter
MSSAILLPEEKKQLRSVIFASSVGTLIEWYDFFIFGSLATILSVQFFPQGNPTAAFLSTLATFAAGFVVRPFGAIVFGRLGDLVGRKYTFLVTLVLMGGATFAMGLVPGYETIGLFAPLIVVVLRLLQGLALGGEYGGAATYVAEHAPAARRGYYTSFIQTTATLGFFVSLGVILGVRQWVGVDHFNAWGWRVPFLLSALLVGVSVYIRLKMQESPLFLKIKKEGKVSKNPIRESFGRKDNLYLVLIALFGATAGQGVVWYTGQFYALSFIQKTCHIEFVQSYQVLALALALGTPLFIVFGSWSDTFGRKYIMLGGMLLAVLLYRPIYRHMHHIAQVSDSGELTDARSTVRKTEFAAAGGAVRITTHERLFANANRLVETTREDLTRPAAAETRREVVLGRRNMWTMVALVFVQMVFVAMAYGPIAAFLVELFPTRIRYTSMSLPYHIGNGIFGGLTPFLATSLFELSKTQRHPAGDVLAGLWYPILIAGITFVIGMIFLSNKRRGDVAD